MSRTQRIALVVGAVAVVAIAFAIAQSGGSNDKGDKTSSSTAPAANGTTTTTPAAPAIPHIEVVGGKPQGGVKKLTVKHNNAVRFSVTSDVADEIHVHGYDFHKDVTKGGTVSFNFPAKIEGVFVVELESRSEQIASLVVNP